MLMNIDQIRKLPVPDMLYARLKQEGKPVGQNEIVMNTLREHIKNGDPIRLAGFWGIGEKNKPDDIDTNFMKSLERLKDDIQQQYQPGMQIIIILADMHGVFNGEVLHRNNREIIQANIVARYRRVFHNAHAPYLAYVEKALHERRIETVWLSDLYKSYGLEIPNIHHPIDESSGLYSIFAETEQRRNESYIKSAQEHNRRGVSPQQAAFHYIRERVQEKSMLTQIFPQHILFVNGGRNLAIRLVPEETMPILYLNAGPVWFQKAEQGGGEEK